MVPRMVTALSPERTLHKKLFSWAREISAMAKSVSRATHPESHRKGTALWFRKTFKLRLIRVYFFILLTSPFNHVRSPALTSVAPSSAHLKITCYWRTWLEPEKTSPVNRTELVSKKRGAL